GGTSVELMRSTEEQFELDALKAEYGGEVSGLGYERSAALNRFQGSVAQRAGYVGAAVAGLSGATRLYNATGAGTSNVPSVIMSSGGMDSRLSGGPYNLNVGRFENPFPGSSR